MDSTEGRQSKKIEDLVAQLEKEVLRLSEMNPPLCFGKYYVGVTGTGTVKPLSYKNKDEV